MKCCAFSRLQHNSLAPMVRVREGRDMRPMLVLTSSIMALALACTERREDARGTSVRPGSVIITATFDHNEWTPPGRVSLDLRTGRYEVRPVPSMREWRAGIRVPVRHGRLAAVQFERVRSAFETARAHGLIDPSCEGGREPSTMIVSNEGPIMMSLATGSGTLATPDSHVGARRRAGCTVSWRKC